ncbi:hypothetical protein KBD61_02500 [Patescibacteria group bacterium]|nr:hypothetical protein [Patescibacteria group bacterium]MBP9709877.1 hypothetical protein [Patescibacteria group bacterium]
MSRSLLFMDSAQRSRFGGWMSFITDVCLALLVVIGPGLAAATFERAELFKQGALIGLVGVALVARTVRSAVERRSEIRMGWSNILLALFGIGVFFATIFSVHPYLSLVGQFSQRAWTFSSIAALLVFAWLVAQRARMLLSFSAFLFLFLLGCLGVAGAGMWSVFSGEAVTVAGSVYALSLCASVGSIVALGVIAFGRRIEGVFSLLTWPGMVARGSSWVLWLVSFVILLRVQFWVAWMMVLVGVGCFLTLIVLGKHDLFKKTKRGAWLLVAIVIGIVNLVAPITWKTPVAGEVGLSMSASWQITQQTVAAHPWLGTGPGTWAYDYALYRAPQFNNTPFWANRFDRASSQFLTLFATTGMVVSGLFVLFLLAVFGVGVHGFLKRHSHRVHDVSEEGLPLQMIVFSGWTAMSVGLFFYNMNLSHQILFWTLTGGLMGFSAHMRLAVDGMRRPWKWVLPMKAAGMSLGVLVVLVLGGQTLWAQAKTERVVSAYQRGEMSAEEVMKALQSVRAIHPWDDVSARALAQAYLVQVLQRVKDTPTNERSQVVSEQVTSMVDIALEATRLAPANPDSWANAGIIYSGIAPFTQGADGFAVKQYQEAMQRDPQHPDYPYQIGSLFLLRAQQLQVLFEAKEANAREQAIQQAQQALLDAARWTQVSLRLKPDYLPARYQEAVILHRQGKGEEAFKALEYVVAQDPTVDRVFELGILAMQINQSARATAAFEKVLELDATQVRARWQLASLYEEAGRLSDALVQLRLVAASVPTNTAVQKRLQVLEERVGGVR